jgi:hypothetical protein
MVAVAGARADDSDTVMLAVGALLAPTTSLMFGLFADNPPGSVTVTLALNVPPWCSCRSLLARSADRRWCRCRS